MRKLNKHKMISDLLAYMVPIANIDKKLVAPPPQQKHPPYQGFNRCPLCLIFVNDWDTHEWRHRSERDLNWKEAAHYAHRLGVELDDIYSSFLTAYIADEAYARQMIVDYLLNQD